MGIEEQKWLPVLRARDEVFLEDGDWDLPHDFDGAAATARFDRLVELLNVAYGGALKASRGPMSDTTLFGSVTVPAEITRTRTKRTRIPLPLSVLVSNFGGLATYRPLYDWSVPQPHPSAPQPVHGDDRRLIEQALAELDYLIVPSRILDLPYDGVNRSLPGHEDWTWFTRFFDFI